MSAPLPWLEEAWRRVLGQRQAGRLPHALLVVGPLGVGKLAFARALAAALLCERGSAEGQICSTCRGCRLLAAGTHPDFLEVSPQEDSKNIKIDQIRELGAALALTSHYGGAKVALVQPADAMNVNAANSLLKTLEEPSAGTLLILVTARPAALPATVRSRCQLLRCPVPRTAVALDWLGQQTLAAEAGPPEQLLRLAHGAPLAALALTQGEALGWRTRVVEDLAEVAEGRADPVAVAAQWLKAGLDVPLYWLYSALADLIRVRSAPEAAAGLANSDLLPALQRIGQRLDLRDMLARLERLMTALNAARGQANAQLLLEDLLIGWTPESS